MANFWHLDKELGFWEMDMFGSLAIEFNDSVGNFGVVEHGLDKQEGVLDMMNAHYNSWERNPCKEMEFGKGGGDLGKLEMDFGDLGVDFLIVDVGRFDKLR